MLSHISVLFQGTTQLHNFASHDIHPTSTTHSSYLSLPFWRWIPRSYGFRTTRFSQNISSIKLGLQENSQMHIFDKPVPVSNGSFLSSFASFSLEKREEDYWGTNFQSGCGDKTYHGIKPIKVNAHKTSQPCWLIRGLDLKEICFKYFIFKDKSFCCNLMSHKLNWLQQEIFFAWIVDNISDYNICFVAAFNFQVLDYLWSPNLLLLQAPQSPCRTLGRQVLMEASIVKCN